MISKQDQKFWWKIECARGLNTRQCYEGLREACDECALPHRTVAWWVKAFRDGRQNVTGMPQAGRPAVSEEDVQNITIRELVNNVGLAHSTVLQILKKQLQMRKIDSKWFPHDLIEQQKWLRYEAARVHL